MYICECVSIGICIYVSVKQMCTNEERHMTFKHECMNHKRDNSKVIPVSPAEQLSLWRVQQCCPGADLAAKFCNVLRAWNRPSTLPPKKRENYPMQPLLISLEWCDLTTIMFLCNLSCIFKLKYGLFPVNCPIDIFPAQKKNTSLNKTHEPTTGRVWRNCHFQTHVSVRSVLFRLAVVFGIHRLSHVGIGKPKLLKAEVYTLTIHAAFYPVIQVPTEQCTTNSLQTWKCAEM